MKHILKCIYFEDELSKQLEDFLNDGGLVSQIELTKTSPVTVYAESTPNPGVMKFVVNKKLFNDVYEFKKVEETKDAPLAKSLFTFPFIKEIFFDFNFISIIQRANSNWDENVMDVREFIRSFIQDDNVVIYEENFVKKSDPKIIENLDDVSKKIIEIIEEHVKPAVASDGGNIVFKSYDKESKKVNVILQGACSGCPSSTITLKSGIENMLKEMLPKKETFKNDLEELMLFIESKVFKISWLKIG